jgi:hypothetical protein
LATLQEPGHVGSLNDASWALQVQWSRKPAASAFDLTAHGYRLDDTTGQRAVAWVAQAGVLVMDLPGDAQANLVAPDHTVVRSGDYQFVDATDHTVGLFIRKTSQGQRVILACRTSDSQSIQALIESWIQTPIESLWVASAEPYGVFWAGQSPGSTGNFQALARAVDGLSMTLRAPAGGLPFWWAYGKNEEGEGQITNHLYAQVRAWSIVHPPVAASLVKSVLSAQQEGGSIPRVVRPDGFHDIQWTPLPLLARSAWMAWQAEPNREFHDYVMPRLHRYLQWAISYYDPDWSGLPVWRDAREAWIPETYDPLVASTDLPALLASELDAMRDLTRAMPSGGPSLDAFVRYRTSLSRVLSGFFWNRDATIFQDRFPAGDHVIRLTLSAALPLLDTTLSRDTLQPVAERLAPGGALRDQRGARDWAAWPDEPSPPPVREEHQLLILDALEGVGEMEIASRMRQDLATRFTEETEHPVEARAAALRLVVLGRSVSPARPFAMISPLLSVLDRYRMMVVAGVIAVIVILLLAIVGAFMAKRSMTIQNTDASAGLAHRLFQEGKYAEARLLMREIVDSGRTFPGMFTRLGNNEYRLGNMAAAEDAFRKELDQDPNAAVATLNLALTLIHSERVEEAKPLYQDITNRFNMAAPELAARAALALKLLSNNPPPTAFSEP